MKTKQSERRVSEPSKPSVAPSRSCAPLTGSAEWDKRLLAGISEIIYNADPESVWGTAEDILKWIRAEGVIPPNEKLTD